MEIESLIRTGKWVIGIISVIVLLYSFVKFLIDIRQYFVRNSRRIRGLFSRLKAYLNEKVWIVKWHLLLPLVLFLGLLILSYLPTKNEDNFEPKVQVTEFIYNGKNYKGGITVPEINKSVTLICNLPNFLNITNMVPKGDRVEGHKIIWYGANVIQLEGLVSDFIYPFYIKTNFNPQNITKGKHSIFSLNIIRLSEINKKYNEFISVYFYCFGCSITSKDNYWAKFLESSLFSFYSWKDLDSKEVNSFEFDVKSEEEIIPNIEILYYSNGIINCSAGDLTINYDSRINYYPQAEKLSISA